MSYITTPDGKNHWVMSDQDIIDLICTYVGMDVRQFLTEKSAKVYKLQEKVDDLSNELEWEYEDNRCLLVDIRDVVDDLRSKPRVDRSTLNRTLTELYNMCNERL